eukprot:TRINITY_DN28591_c0_g1_i1.p1 TRINITY_DN28591_c0_g1~~TRINITY_DN28591_c0_g1_i1.p1  ORF type:complete len:458 (-),score=62.49 TRINITY_DN28591_c0_g1_i1:164-1537(-)
MALATFLAFSIPLAALAISFQHRNNVSHVKNHQQRRSGSSLLRVNEGSRAKTNSEVLERYATWHTDMLAQWRKEGQHDNCKNRRARVVQVDRGLGDAGMTIMNRYRSALTEGDMIMLYFVDGPNNVWNEAMVAPFNWSLAENLDVFCFKDEAEYKDWLSKQTEDDSQFVVCPTCSSASSAMAEGPKMSVPIEDAELLHFMYKPTDAVMRVVDEVLGKVSADERLFGVHFRSEWTGEHFACGCRDPSIIGKCASNLGPFFASRGVGKSEDKRKIKYFVASDQLNGIGAFQRAFGKDQILALPDELPIEHALSTTNDGSIRVMADFVLLSKAEVQLGTCGSTFTGLSQAYSGRPASAFISTGPDQEEAWEQCVAGAQKLDYSGFAFDSFTLQPEEQACGCYADSDIKYGTCTVECSKSSTDSEKHASQCASWSGSHVESLIARLEPVLWRTPLPRTIFA